MFTKALRSTPTLDVRQLNETALRNTESIFEEMKYQRMLPFNQMDEDEVRWELDLRCLVLERIHTLKGMKGFVSFASVYVQNRVFMEASKKGLFYRPVDERNRRRTSNQNLFY